MARNKRRYSSAKGSVVQNRWTRVRFTDDRDYVSKPDLNLHSSFRTTLLLKISYKQLAIKSDLLNRIRYKQILC